MSRLCTLARAGVEAAYRAFVRLLDLLPGRRPGAASVGKRGFTPSASEPQLPPTFAAEVDRIEGEAYRHAIWVALCRQSAPKAAWDELLGDPPSYPLAPPLVDATRAFGELTYSLRDRLIDTYLSDAGLPSRGTSSAGRGLERALVDRATQRAEHAVSDCLARIG